MKYKEITIARAVNGGFVATLVHELCTDTAAFTTAADLVAWITVELGTVDTAQTGDGLHVKNCRGITSDLLEHHAKPVQAREGRA